MEYKIVEIKYDNCYYYVVVGRNNPKEKWHVLCDARNFTESLTKASQSKLKNLYLNGFLTVKGEFISNENVTFSATYSAQQFINLCFTKNCNLVYFYGLGTGEIINDFNHIDFFNEFLPPSLNQREDLFIRKQSSEEDGFYLLEKNAIQKNNLISNYGRSFSVKETNLVAVGISNMYPVFHYDKSSNATRTKWFIPEPTDGEMKKIEKPENVTIKKIINEFLATFNAKVHNFNGTGLYSKIDPIIFQFPKCSKEERTKIESELLDFLKRFGTLGGFGLTNNHATVDGKFLFWISFGSLNDTMEVQNKLKFAASIDQNGNCGIEPVFAENETILSYLKEKNLTFDEFLETDFAKENENLHIFDLISKIKILLEKESEQKNIVPQFEKITKKEIITPPNASLLNEIIPDEIPRIDVQEVKIEKAESKKSEIKAAAMRSVAKKTIDLSAIAAERAASRFVKTKPMRDSIKKICQMPILKNVFGVGIGYALPVMPLIGAKPITKEIAEEIRIEGMSGIADATIGPLMGLFDSMMEKMPADEVEEKNRIEVVKSTEIDQNDYCEEENVERKNRS